VIAKLFELLYTVSVYTSVQTVYYVLGSKNQLHVLDQAINVAQNYHEQDPALAEAFVNALCSVVKLESLEVSNPRDRLIRDKLLAKPGFETFLAGLASSSDEDLARKVDLTLLNLHA